MAQRIPIPGISGSLAAVAGDEAEVHIPPGSELTGVFLTLARAPEVGGSAAVEINPAPGGGGGGAPVAFGAGDRAATWVGSIDVSALTSLWRRLDAVVGTEALGLAGEIELDGGRWLTTLEHVRELYGLSYSESRLTASTLDALAARKLSAVSERFRQHTRRHLTKRVLVAERHDHPGRSPILQLFEYPLLSVQAVRVDGTALAAGTDFLAGPFDPRDRDAAAGHLVRLDSAGRPRAWEAGEGHIEVDYTAGFDAIPEDLAEACALQVIWELKRSPAAGQAFGLRSTIEGEAQATYLVDAIHPDVRDILATYRAPVVG